MKPQLADETAPQAARVEFTVRFSAARPAAPPVTPATPPPETMPPQKPSGRRWAVVPTDRPAKTALLLALAHHWERLVRDGVVRDYAEIARLAGLTRSRVTQILNLTLLAPDIQISILLTAIVGGREGIIPERVLRGLSQAEAWSDQRALLLQAARS